MNYGKNGVRAKQRALNSKGIKWRRKIGISFAQLLLIFMIGAVICCGAAGFGAFQGILTATPKIRLEDVVASGEATIVFDIQGNEIDKYVSSNSNRLRVDSLDELPDYLGKAFVAIEDERFYQHNGIDFKALVRAGWQFIASGGRETQGASTITQQLLKNTVFTEWASEGRNMIKKIKRKLQEQYLALELTKYYPKDNVLLEYMNAINLGQNTLGVEAAAKRYFGKSASDLTLSESAVIACITQNPSGYNPIRFPENNARRREKCLDKMLELEFITQEQYDEAIADTEAVYARISYHDVDFRDNTVNTSGSYFSDALYEQVLYDLIHVAGYNDTMAVKMLTSGGLRIESTMDSTIQAIADEEYQNPANFPLYTQWYLEYALSIYDAEEIPHHFSKENMVTWFKRNIDMEFDLLFESPDAANQAIATYREAMLDQLGIVQDKNNVKESINITAQPQSALVISDQETGYVVAMVGGRGAKEGRRTFNRAMDAKRSPGSTFKVLATFAPALDAVGQTLATVYEDAPFNYINGTPVNNWYETGYRGINSIRTAIAESMNIVAVKAQTVITPRLGYDYLLDFGFTTLTDGTRIGNEIFTDVNQTLALGGLTVGATPYEVNAAYAAIANQGTYVTPTLYTRVTDTNGNVILDKTNPETRQVIKDTTAYLLTNAMEDTVKTGTATSVRFNKNMAIAGKTGTSSKYVDAWFAGYTPYYTCTIWTGYDNNHGMDNTGSDIETNTSKNLWKSIMKRVHEDLPAEQFEAPPGLVERPICSLSGLLPIAGLCDAHTTTEIFEEGTAPYEHCNLHYEGWICEYEGVKATAECPFGYHGVTTLPLVEDPSLHQGSTIITVHEDGTETYTPPRTSQYCQHDAAFFMNPDYESVIYQQQWEISCRYTGYNESYFE